jgi:uncharacterized protein (DUF362 family)
MNTQKFGRREFLGTVAALPLLRIHPMSWMLSEQPRRSHRLFTHDEKSILVVVEGENLRRMIELGLSALPGFSKFVSTRQSITLKPNATTLQQYPVTSDVKLCSEFLNVVRDLTRCPVSLSDSPSHAGLTAQRVFSKLGYFHWCQKEGVHANVIDPVVGSNFVKVTFSGNRLHHQLLINKDIYRSDFVVNFAIPKRHHIADFSCAMKNNFGCVYETFRALAHSGNELFFDRSLTEFADAIRPELTIVDARQLLARMGPSYHAGQSEIIKDVNKIILGNDMVAIDSYCAELMQKHDSTFSKKKRLQNQLDIAATLNLGRQKLSNVEIIEISA